LNLVSGATLSQLITAAASPLLTRLFDPEAFGLYSLLGSITGMVWIVGCMRYEDSILLPDADEEAANQLGVCVLFALLVSAASLVAVQFGARLIVQLLKAPPLLGSLLWFTPPMVLISSISLAFNSWATRQRRFGQLSVTRVSASATSTGVQLAGGYSGYGTATTLVASSLIGNTVGTGILGGQILRRDGALLRRSVRAERIWRGLVRYRKFPLYGTASTLLNNLSWELPALLLQHYFSAAVVGFYALGNALLRLPMGVIGGAISQVFFQRAADAYRRGTLTAVAASALRRLAALSVVPLMVVAILGKELFIFFFGSRWSEAGVYAQILAPWIFVWFISSPLSSVFSVLERQEFGLKFNPVVLGTRFLSLAAGGWLHSPRLALAFFSASGVALYGFYAFAILRAAGLKPARIGRDLFQSVIVATPVVVILLTVKLTRAPGWMAVAASLACLAAYALYLVRHDPAIVEFVAGSKAARPRRTERS
jgi:O-antigen/teichoic acid export membrane protein